MPLTMPTTAATTTMTANAEYYFAYVPRVRFVDRTNDGGKTDHGTSGQVNATGHDDERFAEATKQSPAMSKSSPLRLKADKKRGL